MRLICIRCNNFKWKVWINKKEALIITKVSMEDRIDRFSKTINLLETI
jgi:hypothetical protein